MPARLLAEWSVADGRGRHVRHRLVQVETEPVFVHPRSVKAEVEERSRGGGDYIVEYLAPDAMGIDAWRLFFAWSPSMNDPAHVTLTALAAFIKENP